MTGIHKKVFVLDADMAHCLTVTRSLHKTGIALDVASHIPWPITRHSNSVSCVFIYPDPLKQEDAFISWLCDHLKSHAYDLVIPVTERTIVPIIRHGMDKKVTGTIFATSPADTLEVVLDKSRTLALAQHLNIPVPQSFHIGHIHQLEKILPRLAYPVVLKPSRSIGSDTGGSISLTVDYAKDENGLKSKAAHLLRFGDVILQEHVKGKGVGVEIIADHGRIHFFFQHERLHEVPLSGGGSSLRKGVPLIPELRSATVKIIEALKWHGVAMVEYKYNPADGSYALMEINGRLWGSLPLAVASGADFPRMIYELFVSGSIHHYPAPENGIVCRKLSRDIYWHEMVLRKDYQTEITQLPGYLSVLKDLALIFSARHRFDVQTWHDPKPGIFDIVNIVSENTNRVREKIGEKLFFYQQKRFLKTRQFAKLLNNTRQILFVCYGNINRSILAEKAFIHKYADNNITCISAGFHEEEGRPADKVMIEIAREIGFDLTDHRSRCLTQKMLEESDVVFVMGKDHYDKITKSFIDDRNKIFLLGLMTNNGPEIKDPYGKQVVEYRRCAEHILACINCHLFEKNLNIINK